MSINYDSEGRIFTIHTDNTTYQMQADPHGSLLHLYYGRRTEGRMDWLLTYADRGFSSNPYDAGTDRTYSLDFLPQEFPSIGTGDHRSQSLIVADSSGTVGCALKYKRYRIHKGKAGLKGLPAVYSDSDADDASTLEIVLVNERTGVEVTLYYGVLPHIDIITRSAVIRNTGSERVTVRKLQSACLDFVSGGFDLMTFCGRHAMERVPERAPLRHGSHVIGSSRGTSSHQYNPFVILSDRDATETSGRCWSMQFVYSGGFMAEAEVDQFGQTRLQMGLAESGFAYPLEPGCEIIAPEVIMSFSRDGFGRLSHSLHKCIRKHVCRGVWRDRPRPVLLNSWEASYFNFTGESILSLADQAKDLGMDMLVLDDGWFGSRDDDFRSLGDWQANEKKLGMTLGELAGRVNAKGLKFGIWMEPEMVSEDSDLYRAHPDWALRIPGEDPVRARYQLVLDLSREDVRDEVFRMICEVLDQGKTDYLKWDCNRSINEVFSHASADQGKVLYDHILGLYDILGRLNDRYPELLVESCSGGGGRFDAGMLYYTPQIWCSDNTDAIERLTIQYGTSFGYPSSAVGAHISACPNHQTGRSVPLSTRAAVAMSGAPGCELDPALLTEEEKAEIRDHVSNYRRLAGLIIDGLYYRLSDPAKDDFCSWEYVSEDGNHALVTAVIPFNHANRPVSYVVPRGLKEGSVYRDRATGVEYPADALMDMGLPLPQPHGDAASYIFELERIGRTASI